MTLDERRGRLQGPGPLCELRRAWCLVAAIASVFFAPAGHAADVFRAGAAVMDISPTGFPVIVNAMFTERTATETVDRLNARALVLDDGTIRVAIAVVDSCMVPRTLIDQAKAEASAATGIPVDRMLISSTHTHSAPAAMGCLGSRVDPRYAAFLPGRIAAAIKAAAQHLEPARMGRAAVDDWDHTFNRRWIRRPDRLINDPFGNRSARAHMHPGHESADAIGPSGPVDPGLSILAFQSLAGRPIAVLANYSQHYYGSPLLSSDYYGRFADHLAKALVQAAAETKDTPPFVGIMSQGTSGDLMWMDYGAPAREIGYDAYAREIAGIVTKAYAGMRFESDIRLAMAERKLALNYRVPDAARLEWAQSLAATVGDRLPSTLPEIYAFEALHLHRQQSTELVLQALRLGDVGIAAIPNEVYAITGLKVKAGSPLPLTFNIGLANGAEGYIPPPEQHRLGGYTTWPARTAGLEVEAEPKIVETLLTLLEEVSAKQRRTDVAPPSPYSEVILKSRPLAYWRLEEMVFGTARDATAHGHHATMEGGVALYLPGVGSGDGISPVPRLEPSRFSSALTINRAIHLAGGRLRANLPLATPEFTVGFWFWNGLPVTHREVTARLFARGQGEGDGNRDLLGITGTLSRGHEGRLFFGEDPKSARLGRTPLKERSWNHVALVRKRSEFAVYLNGQRDPEISGPASALSGGIAAFFFGGAGEVGSDVPGLEGKLDEVALWDRALTTQEVRAHFDAAGGEGKSRSAKVPTASDPLSPQESLARIRVPAGFRVELVASEPLVLDPVAIDWDLEGRLWVVEMADYPMGMDGKGKPGGRVRVLEDVDRDGKYDRSVLFAEGLNFPNGILTWRDGVLVSAAPEILYLRDTDGDGRADVREVLLSGFLEGNQQLRVNGLRWGLDGWVYCAAGGHHRGHGAGTRIRSTRAGVEVALGSRDFRFKPDTGEVDPESGPTQFGRNRDDWGHWFGTQNSWPLWHFVLPDSYLRRNPHVASPDPVHHVLRPMNPEVFPVSPREKRYHSFDQAGHFTSACGGMIYRDELLFGRGADDVGFTCEPFHNLVHRTLVREDGVSFVGRRAPEDAASEFFASEDSWCRPVMTRTGPDGALWVVDMYRYMIEHPDWLPEEGRNELLPHYREGDDKGRIYRVLPTGRAGRAPAILARMTTAQLVEALKTPNGWQRDKVHQVLLWRGDRSAIPLLESVARDTTQPLARLHALWILNGLGSLDPTLIQSALEDPLPGLRENALRLAESQNSESLMLAALGLVDDPSPKVRMQLAFTLGEWSDARAGAALAALACAGDRDPYQVAAILSSAVPHHRILGEAVLARKGSALETFFQPLLEIALGLNDRDGLDRLLSAALSPAADGFDPAQMEIFRRFNRLLSDRGTRLKDFLAAAPDDALSRRLRRAPELYAAAARLAGDARAADSDRITGAHLAMYDDAYRGAALKHLAAWLKPQVTEETQRRAVEAMTATGDPGAAPVLLETWAGLGPGMRSRVIDTLLGRDMWALELLQRIESGQISPRVLDPARRARLAQHSNARLRSLAKGLLGEAVPTTRAAIIESYQPALALSGNAKRGSEIHARLCVTCHQHDSKSTGAGPDLRSVASHPPAKLLANILDPSADVQPGYEAYHCTLTNGEELYGVIAAETGNSIVLRVVDGSARMVRRADVAELRGSNLSLMPEGLESGLSHQDMADLIQLLREGIHP